MRSRLLAAAILLAACVSAGGYVPPQPAPTQESTAVRASFGKTWDAVVEQFARQNIPIRTIDRASGFIAAEPLRTGNPPTSADSSRFADCGRRGDVYFLPTDVVYNVVVRGDSTKSTVKTTARWSSSTLSVGACETRGAWEHRFEDDVRYDAESKR